MTQQPATEQEYLIPDEIARAAVLPGSYTDEENTVFPAYAWLRANNPLGLAKLEGFDPLWLVTKHADIMAIERNPELFPAGVNNAILNDQASDNFTRSLTGGTTRIMDAVPFMDPPEHTTYRGVVDREFLPRAVTNPGSARWPARRSTRYWASTESSTSSTTSPSTIRCTSS